MPQVLRLSERHWMQPNYRLATKLFLHVSQIPASTLQSAMKVLSGKEATTQLTKMPVDCLYLRLAEQVTHGHSLRGLVITFHD